jgi:hypothetical protein
MSNRTLNQELAILDDEIEELEARRIAVILRIETSGLRKNSLSNLIPFSDRPRIPSPRSDSDRWVSDPAPTSPEDRQRPQRA